MYGNILQLSSLLLVRNPQSERMDKILIWLYIFLNLELWPDLELNLKWMCKILLRVINLLLSFQYSLF